LVLTHQLEGCVKILGNLPQMEVARYMSEADVFVFPSIRDSGAGVIAEAMMSGMPSIVVNYGPPQYLLNAECGIRVSLGTIQDHINDFTIAMENLALDPVRRITMGTAARLRAQRLFDWDVKGARIRKLYNWILGENLEKPDFYSEEPV